MVHQYVGGDLTSCSTGPISSLIPTIGTVQTVKFKVDSAGTASIYVDGIHILNCFGVMLIPTNTARIHTAGTGTYITEHPEDEIALQGAIIGLRVTTEPLRQHVAMSNTPWSLPPEHTKRKTHMMLLFSSCKLCTSLNW